MIRFFVYFTKYSKFKYKLSEQKLGMNKMACSLCRLVKVFNFIKGKVAEKRMMMYLVII